MAHILVTPEEKELLVDVIDLFLEGSKEAKDETIRDKSIDNPEDLLSAAATYDRDRDTLERIKKRLTAQEQLR